MATTTLDQALNDYLAVRRALGFKLAENGRLLPDFVAYLHAAGASSVTTELAVAWATQPTGCTPVWWARRLAMVRDEGVLTVWNSKFQKSRALPLHPTTMTALGGYARLRDELCPHPKAPSFFVTTRGARVGRGFNDVFAGLVRSAGLDGLRQRRPVLLPVDTTRATPSPLGPGGQRGRPAPRPRLRQSRSSQCAERSTAVVLSPPRRRTAARTTPGQGPGGVDGIGPRQVR